MTRDLESPAADDDGDETRAAASPASPPSARPESLLEPTLNPPADERRPGDG